MTLPPESLPKAAPKQGNCLPRALSISPEYFPLRLQSLSAGSHPDPSPSGSDGFPAIPSGPHRALAAADTRGPRLGALHSPPERSPCRLQLKLESPALSPILLRPLGTLDNLPREMGAGTKLLPFQSLLPSSASLEPVGPSRSLTLSCLLSLTAYGSHGG